jgi:hypothetical protein
MLPSSKLDHHLLNVFNFKTPTISKDGGMNICIPQTKSVSMSVKLFNDELANNLSIALVVFTFKSNECNNQRETMPQQSRMV